MASSGALISPIQRSAGGDTKPLSFGQERLYLLDRMTPGLGAYNVPTLVRIPGTLDERLLERAFDAVIARHEILRTRIGLIDGNPRQTIMGDRKFKLEVFDLRSHPAAERDRDARRLLGELAGRPFDLGADLLLRAGLAHLGSCDLLLVVFHHIGSDHASSSLLFGELDELYRALQETRDPELPELPIQYADFAQWQREELIDEHLDVLTGYWQDKLAGAPERLELPTDRPRPAVQSYRGTLREFSIDSALSGRLRELARREGVSMFMVLLAAFQTLLHRYTGAEDLVVGAPASGRHREEIASLLGFFSNTLALRTDLSGDPTFSELLARVKLTAMEAQIFQELPFEKLVEVLNPERAQSHSPIFQVLMGYDVAPERPPTIAGHALELLPIPGWEWSRFDLSIVLRDVPEGSLHAHLEYATDLFDASTIERLIGHLRTLLDGAAKSPSMRLSELPLITGPELELMLEQWNSTRREIDPRCVHELIAARAAQAPESIAVVSADGKCTYAELEVRSNQLARELLATGAGPGTLVAISAERGIEMMVGLLGTLKSGAAYVPIDPTYPPQRQELMVTDSGARILLTQDRFLGTIDPGEAQVICLDRDWSRIAGRSGEELPPAATPDGLAYVIYTSGSTGRPKGVEISHRALSNFLAAMREQPGLSEQDVLLAVTTLSFDIAALELYLPLTVGARLIITPLEATMDAIELADWLARSGATFMQATPTTWQLLVDAGWKGGSSLTIACGGEALPRALAEELLDRCRCLWHMYGPTETTIWSSVLALGPGQGTPLGGPIANTTFYVLDGSLRPVPIGVSGELYIGGRGLAEGYHGQPELTAERFVPNPLSGGGERLYRTGDLVRWREDGKLDFLGRIDQQVKLRGFRIELEEIEAALAHRQELAGAVVVVREDVPGDKRLVAYLVARGDAGPDTDVIRAELRAKLPPYMVPSAFVVLDSFPTTPNGKLDRNALPALDGARPDLERPYLAPETPVQESLAAIWSEVLAIDRIGIDDDFFDLGGHSLLAVRMLARVHDDLGVELPLRDLFDGATVRKLAASTSEVMLGHTGDEELASLLAEVEGATQ